LKNRKIILTMFSLLSMINTVIMSGCGAEEKMTEYTFPETILTSTGQTQESAIEELKPRGNKYDLVTDIRKGDNG